jgi:hypothetical protein
VHPSLDGVAVPEHAVIMVRRRRRTTGTPSTALTAVLSKRDHLDYRHLPERPDPSSWITGEDVTPPNSGPRRFAINDDVWLIERFIGLG